MVLTKSLHVKVHMQKAPGQPPQLVHPHKVPNVCITQIGAQRSVRLFFPVLMEATEGHVELTEDQLTAIYEQGLYPVICYLALELVTNWSPTYAAANDTAHRLRCTIKCYLHAALSWAHECIWMVQIQGVKEAHTHAPNSIPSSRASFGVLMDGLMEELILQGHSWIDLGLQISEENHVLQWCTDAHHFLIKEFRNITFDAAACLYRLPSCLYHCDYMVGVTQVCRHVIREGQGMSENIGNQYDEGAEENSVKDTEIVTIGLVDLSDFWATLNPLDLDPHSAYIQAYITDKSYITHLEAGRHRLFMREKDALLGDGDDHIPAHCKRMKEIYQAGICHMAAAQVEARVSAQSAIHAMLDFPEDLLNCMLC
ncbi:hypothetical protein OG21DRAFT_1527739 [Imleria badia]|nr:hypothetical protein OG21DRAFT_1527739 [Imleria badia]